MANVAAVAQRYLLINGYFQTRIALETPGFISLFPNSNDDPTMMTMRNLSHKTFFNETLMIAGARNLSRRSVIIFEYLFQRLFFPRQMCA